ncbi:MAG: hypothetical protein ACOX05_04810 [Bacillota bacterium]|jgi:uncharacterized membrane protein
MGFFDNLGGGNGCGGGFDCIINLIVILIVLQFICSIFFNNSSDGDNDCACNNYNYEGYDKNCNCGCAENTCSFNC